MQQTHYGNFTTVVTIVTIVAIADEETRTALWTTPYYCSPTAIDT